METQSIDFDFITDERFRATLESDYAEMRRCADARAWKAVHVLAGSIVEAVLADYLVGSGENQPDPLKMGLADLIKKCAAKGILSARTSDLSAAVKSYRNLIHPGRGIRMDESADADSAVLAHSLVSIIVREVVASQQRVYGLTAEQIITKVEADPTALGIADHLLREVPQQEIERLLITVLPVRYLARREEIDAEDDTDLETLGKLFRAAFEFASDKSKRKVMSRYVSVLKQEPAPVVRAYEETFFRATDLKYVTAKNRDMVKAHLLSRLDEEPNEALLETAEGLGKWLTCKDVGSFTDALTRLAVWNHDEPIGEQALTLMKKQASLTPSEVDPMIIRRLVDWEEMFETRDDDIRLDIAQEIKHAYEAYTLVPR